MSYNVRLDTDRDGENRWDCRKEAVVQIVRKHRPAVFGLQVIIGAPSGPFSKQRMIKSNPTFCWDFRMASAQETAISDRGTGS